MTIKRNRLKCRKCGEIIESKYRWDFQWCKCKSIYVDGGHDLKTLHSDTKNAPLEIVAKLI